MLVSLLLLALIALQLAKLTWQIVAPEPEARVPPTTNTSQQTAPRSAGRVNYGNRIASLHLFGEAQITAEQLPQDAPETRLNLKLHGVYATDSEDAMAVISGGRNDEKYYHIGDDVAGGAKLKAVYADRVILERNAQLETLRMPKAKDTGNSSITTTVPTKTRPGRPRIRPGVTSDAVSNFGAGKSFSEVRSDVLKNPARLNDLVKATPHSEGGQFIGYRITPKRKSELFTRIGLENGDIITGVNGMTLDNPGKGLKALHQLRSAQEVNVTLLRNGSEVYLNHTFDE